MARGGPKAVRTARQFRRLQTWCGCCRCVMRVALHLGNLVPVLRVKLLLRRVKVHLRVKLLLLRRVKVHRFNLETVYTQTHQPHQWDSLGRAHHGSLNNGRLSGRSGGRRGRGAAHGPNLWGHGRGGLWIVVFLELVNV